MCVFEVQRNAGVTVSNRTACSSFTGMVDNAKLVLCFMGELYSHRIVRYQVGHGTCSTSRSRYYKVSKRVGLVDLAS